MSDYLPIPLEVLAGCTVQIQAPSHTYGTDFATKLVLSNGHTSIEKTNSAGQFTLSAAETLGMSAGVWGFYFFATSEAAENHLIQKGTLTVLPDPSTAHDFDPRSSAAKMLEQYNALLTNAAFIKTLDPNAIAELEAFRKQLVWDVKREQDAEKLKRSLGGHSNKIYTRFI